MTTHRTLTLAVALGLSATACTAIVFGQLSESDGYPVGDPNATSSSSSGNSSSGTSSSTSSSGADDPCSLLKPYPYSEPLPANECASCIAAQCSDEVTVACGDGAKDKKAWFTQLGSCAQNPWVAYPKPGSSGSSWGCDHYDNPDAGEISGDGDQALQRKSEICVRDNCLRSSKEQCRLCEVNLKGTGTDAKQYPLREDPCGKLFTEHCNPLIVDCCRSYAIDQYVAYCSNTADSDNLAMCRGILDAKTDLAAFKTAHMGGWRDSDFTCATNLAECFDKYSGDYECE